MNVLTRALCVFALAVAAPQLATAQAHAVGDWHGVLATPSGNLTVLVQIRQDRDGLLAGDLESADAPTQKIPLGALIASGAALTFSVPSLGATYAATWNDSTASWGGIFRQGMALPLVLHVERPASRSLADLRAMQVRSQITEVTCEEGWSYVAEWTGTPLSAILSTMGVRSTARYVVYYSSDPEWWESIDIDEAMHPQTLVAWGMNGADLPVPFGGPLRLRVPRQLGYKSVKFVNRLVVTDSLDEFGSGMGQSAANDGYAWYAGI